MADGLSVAASVAGLIQIADIVVRRGYRYVRDVKGAEKSVEQLVDEVNKLSGVLHSLKNIAERCEDDKLEIEPTAQIHHIEACLKTLQLVDTHLENSNPATEKDHVGNIKQKLKWPLNKSKVKELLSEVEKHKAVMNLAMTASSMSALLVMLDRQDCIRDHLLELKEGIEKDRAQKKRIKISEQRQNWLDHLSPINAQRWQDSNIKLRQPGSGVWFTDGKDFQEWLSTERSKLWVYGIPGAGKTILMASAIQEALKHTDESHALAFFYCDYKDPSTHSPQNILGSLAKQIAVQNELCFSDLKDFWGVSGSPGIYNSSGLTTESYLNLVKDLSAKFSSVVIIIDGLDEVATDRSSVAGILQSLNYPGGNIKTLFASRNEIDLQYPLRDYKQLSIAAMSSDLRLYVASEIERRTATRKLRIRDPDLKEYIMRTLVDKADGMFRWVTCQLDYLCECTSDRERREALTKLPPDLPSSYERILDRINNSRNEGNQRLVVRTLQWILYAKRPLGTPALLEALAVEDGDVDIDRSAMTTEEDILHWASSLIRKRVGGGLEIAHFTVKEFLMSIKPSKTPQYSPYFMTDSKEVYIRLARTCLVFLNSETFSNIKPRDWGDVLYVIEAYPFFCYAAKYWDHHAIRDLNDASISLLMHQFFHPATNEQFRLYRIVHLGDTLGWFELLRGAKKEGAVEDSELSYFDDSTPLHWAAYLGLPDLCAWLIGQGLAADQISSTIGTPLNCALLGDEALIQTGLKDLESRALELLPSARPRPQVVQTLLDVGVPTNVKTSPILELLPLSIAVLLEDTASCSALIAAGAQFSNYDLSTAATRVAEEGLVLDMADYIINQALIDTRVISPDAYGSLFTFTITYLSYDLAEVEAKRLLVDLSFHPEALEWACEQDLSRDHYYDLLHLYPLLKGMRCTLQSPERFPSRLRSLVIKAVESCDRAIISFILDTDADALSLLKDADDNGVFHLSISQYRRPNSRVTQQDCLEMVELLVQTGHPVNERNAQGETPLHVAAECNELGLFNLLLGGNAAEDALDVHTKAGLSAYDYAVKARSPSIMELISKHRERSIVCCQDQRTDEKKRKVIARVSKTRSHTLPKRSSDDGDESDLMQTKKRRGYFETILS